LFRLQGGNGFDGADGANFWISVQAVCGHQAQFVQFVLYFAWKVLSIAGVVLTLLPTEDDFSE
jgi:hypothetical protein